MSMGINIKNSIFNYISNYKTNMIKYVIVVFIPFKFIIP